MQRLLLDTHAFLWWLADSERLGPKARAAIAHSDNEAYISAATGWEIAIKKALGKLQAPGNLDAVVGDEGFAHLPITFFHGEQARVLPPLHRDPFDRMLVAQAQAHGLVAVTDSVNPIFRKFKNFNCCEFSGTTVILNYIKARGREHDIQKPTEEPERVPVTSGGTSNQFTPRTSSDGGRNKGVVTRGA